MSATRCCSTCSPGPGDAFAGAAPPARPTTTSPGRPSAGTSAGRSASTASLLAAGVVERLDEPGRARAGSSGSPSTCRTTSPSTSRCRRSRSPRSSCSTRRRRTYAARRRLGGRGRRSTTRGRCSSAQQHKARGEAVAEMKADGHRVRRADGAARGGHLPQAAATSCSRPRSRCTGASHPWVADHALSPEVGRPRHVRAGDDLRRVRRATTGWPASEGLVLRYLGDAYKALRADRAGGRQDRGAARPHRVARRAGPAGRLQPARRVGGSWPTPTRAASEVVAELDRRAAAGHRQRRGRSACWSATRCSAGSSWPPAGGVTTLGELDADAGWDCRRAGPTRSTTYFDEHDVDRHRRRRPRRRRCCEVDERPAAAGRCGRSSTTRPATTTGRSPPRSTWPRPTTSAGRRCM